MDRKTEFKNDLRLIQIELNSFYEFCKESRLSEEEINEICKPLNSLITKARIKNVVRSTLRWIFIIAFVYTLYEFETVKWHGAAIGRIFLIKLLPYWNWMPLYNQQCLVEKTHAKHFSEPQAISCVSCESIRPTQKISTTTYNELLYKFLIHGEPVVITDAYERWYTREKELNFTDFLHQNEKLSDSVPCRLQTNLILGRQPTELLYILATITKPEVDNWFLHFQNCDLNAVKTLRILAPRPYFLSPHIRPSHFNWLLLSKNYDAQRYKHLELDMGLVMMSQLRGKSKVLLVPRVPCEDFCEEVRIELEENETLVLSNSLWEFYYKPMKGENTALISETDWSDS